MSTETEVITESKLVPQKQVQRDVTNSQVFKKSHELVFSRQSLSAREQDILALMLCHMKDDDWGTEERPLSPRYHIPAEHISKILGVKSKNLVATLLKPCERLSIRKVGVLNVDKGEFEFKGYFKNINYKSGVLTIVPNDELRQDYIGGSKGFSLITREGFFRLSKDMSKRLYDVLSRFKTGGTTLNKMPINDLKGLFGIYDETGKLLPEKKTFLNNSVFITRYIKEPIKQMAADPVISKELIFHTGKSGLLGYEPHKTGNKFSHIEFLYSWIAKDQPLTNLNLDDALRSIRKLEGRRKALTITKKKLPLDELELLTANYQMAISAAPVDMVERLQTKLDAVTGAIAKRKAEEKKEKEQQNAEPDFNILSDLLNDEDEAY